MAKFTLGSLPNAMLTYLPTKYNMHDIHQIEHPFSAQPVVHHCHQALNTTIGVSFAFKYIGPNYLRMAMNGFTG